MKRIMKQLSVLVFLNLVAIVSAQEGKVGVNTESPRATLDIKVAENNANGNTAEGIITPQVTTARAEAMGTSVVEGTMLYITDGVTGSGTTSLVKGKGFYYYDATRQKWLKLGSGNESANTQYLTPEYVGATGVWMQNVATSGSTIKFKVTNLASANFSSLNFQNALRLNGALQGAPTSVGNLIAAFNPNAVVSGNANTTKAVNAFANVSTNS